MILDLIDQATPSQLAAGVYQLLLRGNLEPEEYEQMKDRRLMSILVEIVKTNGRPPFAPPNVSNHDAERVTMSAAHLLGFIAQPDDTEAVLALMDLMNDENDRLKLTAARALGEVGATEAADKVVALTDKMVAQGEMGAVAKLARTLARIGGNEAKTRLESFVSVNRSAQDKQAQHVVSEAEAAIKAIDDRLT
jgi:hypothetical protein